jgi:hypothetical protein
MVVSIAAGDVVGVEIAKSLEIVVGPERRVVVDDRSIEVGEVLDFARKLIRGERCPHRVGSLIAELSDRINGIAHRSPSAAHSASRTTSQDAILRTAIGFEWD